MKIAWIGEVSPTPVGTVRVAVSEQGLVAVDFKSNLKGFRRQVEQLGFDHLIEDVPHTAEACQQIAKYLDGKLRVFDLPIDWSVLKPFQEQVLRHTFAIPYGQVATYKEIAWQISKPRAARAVGQAEASNPMPLVIPCHRVVGSDGGLHGYGGGGGIKTKEWLLKLEGAIIP